MSFDEPNESRFNLVTEGKLLSFEISRHRDCRKGNAVVRLFMFGYDSDDNQSCTPDDKPSVVVVVVVVLFLLKQNSFFGVHRCS